MIPEEFLKYKKRSYGIDFRNLEQFTQASRVNLSSFLTVFQSQSMTSYSSQCNILDNYTKLSRKSSTDSRKQSRLQRDLLQRLEQNTISSQETFQVQLTLILSSSLKDDVPPKFIIDQMIKKKFKKPKSDDMSLSVEEKSKRNEIDINDQLAQRLGQKTVSSMDEQDDIYQAGMSAEKTYEETNQKDCTVQCKNYVGRVKGQKNLIMNDHCKKLRKKMKDRQRYKRKVKEGLIEGIKRHTPNRKVTIGRGHSILLHKFPEFEPWVDGMRDLLVDFASKSVVGQEITGSILRPSRALMMDMMDSIKHGFEQDQSSHIQLYNKHLGSIRGEIKEPESENEDDIQQDKEAQEI